MPKFYKHNSLKPFPLEDKSVNLVITSPPYFNQRDYRGAHDQIGLEEQLDCGRVDGQLCLHPESQFFAGCYTCKMLQVARNIRTVLADDGSYWLNIGDSYASNKSLNLVPHHVAMAMIADGWILRNTVIWEKPNRMPMPIKDRLTPAHEYVFFFTKNRKYYFDLDAIRIPHETVMVGKYLNDKSLAAKLGREVQVSEQGDFGSDFLPAEVEGYKDTKLEGQSDINIGARGGFAQKGETLDNRYADGGKNPGDVFTEKRFTREDELRAVEECGFIKGKSARTTARLHVVNVLGHPLGKNPGDVHLPTNEQGETTEGSSGECLCLDGFDIECSSCGSQFFTSVDEFRVGRGDVWHINTEPLKHSHYAAFPKKLVETIVKCSSRVGDTVLDCFSGSGTTAIVAESLHRVGIGFDLSYDDVREQRVAEGIQTDLTQLLNE